MATHPRPETVSDTLAGLCKQGTRDAGHGEAIGPTILVGNVGVYLRGDRDRAMREYPHRHLRVYDESGQQRGAGSAHSMGCDIANPGWKPARWNRMWSAGVNLDVRSLLVVLALLLAGCSSGGQIASTTHPHQALTPAHLRLSAPVTARVVLPSQMMTAGSSMSGQVVVENNTGHAIRVSGCVSLFQVLLTSSTYRPPVAWFTCLQRFTIPVGESRYWVTVWASYSQCSQGRPRHGLRACRPDGRMPPLPPGTYYARLFQVRNLVRVPPALTVRVTGPMPR
jgi:hypothetical protein